MIRKGHLTKLQKAGFVDNVKYIKSEQNIILPILKHVWTKRRSLARIAGELKIIGTIQLEFNTKYLCTHPKKLNKHHVKNARNGCSWEGILQNIMAVTCIECGKALRNSRNMQCNTMCLTWKKVFFFEKENKILDRM